MPRSLKRHWNLKAAALFLLIACPLVCAQPKSGAAAKAEPRTVTPRGALLASEQHKVSLFENAAPSVAYITTEVVQAKNWLEREVSQGAGSGFVWDVAGHVVTNHHVIDNARRVFVQLDAGQPIEAKVIGRAPEYDLAVVQLARVPVNIRPIPLGESRSLKIGQSVYAIGNPFGLQRTLTEGIISALERELPTTDYREVAGVIQTDAAINPLPNGSDFTSSTVSDEFSSATLGLQWQWEANPQPNWCFLSPAESLLKLYNQTVPPTAVNLWGVPNVLLQKFPAANFTATTKLTFYPKADDEETGLLVSGMDYSFISIRKTTAGLAISQVICKDAVGGKPEKRSADSIVKSETIYLKVQVQNVENKSPLYAKIGRTDNESPQGNALCRFSYSLDGQTYMPMGEDFFARKGKWVGSKVGLFAIRKGKTYEYGYSDVDWFRVKR